MITLSILFIFITGIAAECCQSRSMPDGDTYSFYKTMEQSTLGMPSDCLDGCMYTKDGDVSRKLYCFGNGPMESQCGSCGIDNFPKNSRIINGEPTEPHRYPWMVAIFFINENGMPQYICGGSLINNQFILTAAHCTYDYSKENLLLSISEHNITKPDGESITNFCEIINHPYWSNVFEKGFDISLIKLCQPIVFTETLSPVCLPSIQDLGNEFENMEAIVAGWGLTSEESDRTNVLMEVKVKTMSNADCCDASKGRKWTCGWAMTLMCAVEEGPKGSCKGDSGGPLIIKGITGAFTQIGIVSFGRGNQRCTSDDFPGVYTRVSPYLDWIKENSKVNHTSSPSSGQ
ncbi:chymotrypsin-like elastase family member 2A [Eurytemora carolleeae]|uniref:chymotrypsin-like elastase family member 2A n=1 Tax=Eurytemora carolleeae TaxID=1294199 RepID=UPI000C75DF18|nr:chymotrypsin-like elastase family member 2A [Eurytemora carolleeae]|eukprot:XP_023346672.1 chymotrypsin-like elastase family member 2A [Eurytemora affinis]